jgi:hypothetical protein
VSALQKKERISEDLIVSRLRKKLEAWLNKGTWAQKKLLDWLKGYELPAIGHAEEPCIWLLRALLNSDKSYQQEMAHRLAIFMNDEKPYHYINGKYDEEFLSNLFYLCSGLRCPNELFEPLYKAFDFCERSKEKQMLFAGSRYNLSGALREALINNQINDYFQDVWRQMLRGQPHDLLRGNRNSGFDGLLFMPSSAGEGNEPSVEQVGWALAKMAAYLEGDRQRHEAFRRLLERVKEAWPDYRNWNTELLLQAIKHKWPMWAVVRLDTLVVPLDKQTGVMPRYLIWNVYLPYLEELKVEFKKVNNYLDGQIVELRASDNAILFVDKISPTVEHIRLHTPFRSYRSVIGAANEGFMELEVYFASRGKDALVKAITKGRIKILETLGFKIEAGDVLDNRVEISTRVLNQIPLLLKDFFPIPEAYIGSKPNSLYR